MSDDQVIKLQLEIDQLKVAAAEAAKKHDQFFDKVRQMRGVQKEYFKYRAGSDLQKARRLERDVESIIDQEVQIQKSNQKELF
jgi:hypothetical protein